MRRPADGTVLAAVAVAAVLTDVALRSGPDGLAGAAPGGPGGRRAAAQRPGGQPPGPGPGRGRGRLRGVPGRPHQPVAAPPRRPGRRRAAGAGRVVRLGRQRPRPHRPRGPDPGAASPSPTGWPRPPSCVAGRGGRVTSRRAAATARGLVLAVPVLVVLGVLLASADAVFAGFFNGWNLLTPDRARGAAGDRGVGDGRPAAAGVGRASPPSLGRFALPPRTHARPRSSSARWSPSSPPSPWPRWWPRRRAAATSSRPPASPTPSTPAPGSSSCWRWPPSPWPSSSACGPPPTCPTPPTAAGS